MLDRITQMCIMNVLLVIRRFELFKPPILIRKFANIDIYCMFLSLSLSLSFYIKQGVSDGAGSILLATEEAVKKHSLTPLARLIGYAVVGCDPSIMGIGPVPAIQKLLKLAKLN